MIAVIGATGFTGRRIVERLRVQYPDEELVAVVRASSDRRGLPGTTRFHTADLADHPAVAQALSGARLVVSAASLGFGHASTIVAAVEAARPERAVFFSTTSIYTALESRSREVRIEAERLIARSQVPFTILRPTMIYGRPGDRNIEKLLRFLRRSPVFPIIGTGTGMQQPVHVDDLGEAVIGVLNSRQTVGHYYNLSGPRPITFLDLVHEAGTALGREPRILKVPLGLAEWLAGAWSVTGLWPRIRREQLRRLQENKTFALQLAAEHFGYGPRDFSVGVRQEAELLGLLDPGRGSRMAEAAERVSHDGHRVP